MVRKYIKQGIDSNKIIQSDEYDELQFKQVPTPIPWKSICLATLLFTGGGLLLIIGSLLVTGYVNEKYDDRTWPVILLGLLTFIPGAYHVRIAYCAFRGYKGYNFDDIPTFH